MSDKVYVAFNDNAMEEDPMEGKAEMYREDVLATWNACLVFNEAALERIESKWPCGFMATSFDPEQVERWFAELAANGKVSDTEENMCWAIAGTQEEADALLKEEIAKYE
ncbi:hypothetical protein D3C73_931840 [compost metagenome]